MPTNGFSTKPLKVKLLAGEQISQPRKGQPFGAGSTLTGSRKEEPEKKGTKRKAVDFFTADGTRPLGTQAFLGGAKGHPVP